VVAQTSWGRASAPLPSQVLSTVQALPQGSVADQVVLRSTCAVSVLATTNQVARGAMLRLQQPSVLPPSSRRGGVGAQLPLPESTTLHGSCAGEGVAQDAALAMMMESLSLMGSRESTQASFDIGHDYVYQVRAFLGC